MSCHVYRFCGAEGRREILALLLGETPKEEWLTLGFDQILGDVVPSGWRGACDQRERFACLKVWGAEIFPSDLDMRIDAQDDIGTVLPGTKNADIAVLSRIEAKVFEQSLRLWSEESGLGVHIEIFVGIKVAANLGAEIRDE